jgi:CPA1 family monovalent cation:H+ antiporter
VPTDVLLVVVITVVAVSPWLARLSRLPVPTVQFLLGCLLAALPVARRLTLSPELILLVVLPVILFWEGYQTSVTWARRYWRPILLNGVLLVVATAGGVAVIAHLLGFPWPAAWALGAVLAPTDASAVTAFGRALPTSWMTVLRAESLINDGTALVVLAVAIQAANHEHFGAGSVAWRAGQSYGVGIAMGLAVTLLMLLVLRHITDPLVNASFALALPLLAAVPAEALHGSGVVAVVTCGLAGSRGARRITPARMRLPAHAFWEITTFLLTGALFVLSGLQLRGLVTEVSARQAATLVAQGLLVTAVVLVIRFSWSMTMTVLIRTLDRRPVQRTLRVPFRARVVNCWAGLRGGISLAAALTIPLLVAGGPFPRRQELLVITFVVVATTLLVQGSTLGLAVRWASPTFPAPPARDAVTAARMAVTARTLRAFENEWFLTDADPQLRREIQRELADALADSGADRVADSERMRLQLRVLQRKRQELAGLVTDGEVEDSVMWELQRLLDLEEARLEGLLSAAEAATAPPEVRTEQLGSSSASGSTSRWRRL